MYMSRLLYILCLLLSFQFSYSQSGSFDDVIEEVSFVSDNIYMIASVGGPIAGNIGVFVSFWILLSSVYGLINRRKIISLSSFFGHSGLGILILGCSISISSQKQYEGPMSLNENLKIGNYKVRFLNVEDGNGPNYINSTGSFSIENAGRIIKLIIVKLYGWNEKTEIHPKKKGIINTNSILLLRKRFNI